MARANLLAALLLAAFFDGTPASASDRLLAEIQRLCERIERLEARNHALEQRIADGETKTQNALASDRLSENEPELVTRLKAVEFQTLSMQKQARQIESLEGISVSGSLTGVVQTASRGSADTGERQSRANYRADVAIGLPGGDLGTAEGRIFAHFRLGQGAGVGLRPTYSSTPNTLAFETAASRPDDSFAVLAQAWYQLTTPLPLGGHTPDSRAKLELNVGKMDPFLFFDQNAAADDESVRYLNNAFVHNPLLDSGGDIGADAYGFSPGIRVAYRNQRVKSAEWGASLGVFGSARAANFSGSLSRPFVIAQIETARRLLGGLAGNYRVYAWHNGRGAEYDGSLARHSGVGLSIDQRLGDTITVFGRYGGQLSGKVRFDRALTLGAEIGGHYWGRSADALGVAAGVLRTSKRFRRDSATVDANADAIADFGFGAGAGERIVELYYRFRLNKQLDLTPDFQLIQQPGGNGAAKPIHLLALRARASF